MDVDGIGSVVPASVTAAANAAAASGAQINAPVSTGGSAISAPNPTNSSGSATRPGETRAAVDAANYQLAQSGYQFKFQYDDQAHLEVVKIVDSETQQVLQQFPSKVMLAAAQSLANGGAPGTLLQTQA
jgi:flagellar protein FlaG